MLSRRELLSLRLRSLLLAQNPAAGAAGVAQHFLAMQAQDFQGSLWALGVRSGATLGQVEQAYGDGRIVRSWPMRGTLHAVAAEDLGWLLQITAAKKVASAERWQQVLGVTSRDVESVREAAIEALAGGKALSRDALLATVAGRGVHVEKRWKYHLFWMLASSGTIVFGPIEAGEHLIVLADEWVPEPRRLGREEGLAELACRFAAAHGPVSLEDLTWWSGLGKRESAEALALAGDRVAKVEGDGGQTYWMSPEVADAGPAKGTVLLPAFDEHLLGYRDRSAMLDPAHYPAWCPGANGVFKPTVVVDGVCVGTWKPVTRGVLAKLPPDRPIPVEVAWFDQSRTPDPAQLAEAANRYASYLGRDSANIIEP